jgi:hypothetical protein
MSDASGAEARPGLPLAVEGRAAAQLAEQERALVRQRALDSTSEGAAAPDERIRRWEHLHALKLPSAAGHPLLAVIAARTRLTLNDITKEQQRRRELSSPGRSNDSP